MNVIFIQKKWLDTIGDIKDLLLIRSESNDYIAVFAHEKELTVGLPFVEAILIRKLDDADDEDVIPAKIPSSLISGIFDLTKKEAESKFGFVPPKKK